MKGQMQGMIFKSQGMMAEKLSCVFMVKPCPAWGSDGCVHSRVMVLWKGSNHRRVHVISGSNGALLHCPLCHTGHRDTDQSISKWGLVPGSVRTQWGVTQRTGKELLQCHLCHHFQTALLSFSSLVKTIMSSPPQLFWSFQSGWLLHQPSCTLPAVLFPISWKGDRLWSVLPKSPYLEAFRAVPGIFWVLPAPVLLPVCPIGITVCEFEKGTFLPGPFGTCPAGDEPSPCQAGDCEVEVPWGEISALFCSICLTLLVLF